MIAYRLAMEASTTPVVQDLDATCEPRSGRFDFRHRWSLHAYRGSTSCATIPVAPLIPRLWRRGARFKESRCWLDVQAKRQFEINKVGLVKGNRADLPS